MLPMRIELIISSFHDSIQDWCLTTMALEALLRFKAKYGHRESNPGCVIGSHIVYH